MATTIGSAGIIFGDATTQNTASLIMAIEYQTAPIANLQTFDSSGTWNKPSVGSIALVECWGGGGGGAKNTVINRDRLGGAGGGYVSSYILLSSLSSTVTVTVGPGGAGTSTDLTNGLPGSNSSFGTLLIATGGAGGRQGLGLADSAATGGTLSVNTRFSLAQSWPSIVSHEKLSVSDPVSTSNPLAPQLTQTLRDAVLYYGENGGIGSGNLEYGDDDQAPIAGANTVRSGAGGGGRIGATDYIAGISKFGGNGGAVDTNGSVPGGGGGGSGTTSGNGGGGRVRVTVF